MVRVQALKKCYMGGKLRRPGDQWVHRGKVPEGAPFVSVDEVELRAPPSPAAPVIEPEDGADDDEFEIPAPSR